MTSQSNIDKMKQKLGIFLPTQSLVIWRFFFTEGPPVQFCQRTLLHTIN